jgi:5-methylcytosine-specific restriction endonuclease McrA
MRKCVRCGKEKELEKFRKRLIWFSHTCKECYASDYRTGKPNAGRFKKGDPRHFLPKNRPKKYLKQKKEKKERISKSLNRNTVNSSKWSLEVKKRDNFICQGCGANKDLQSHHIVPWKKDETLRFDIENGITLCRSCHSFVERMIDKMNGINNLKGSKNGLQNS